MRIVTLSFELGPAGSGLGRAVSEIARFGKSYGMEFDHISALAAGGRRVLSPRLVRVLGGPAIIEYWRRALKVASRKREHDLVWMNQPLLLTELPSGMPCVITYHTTYRGHRKALSKSSSTLSIYYRIMELAESLTMRIVARTNSSLTTVSRSVCREIESYGIRASRLTIIPNGVDTRRFRPLTSKEELKREWGLSANAPTVLFVGRIDAQKGLGGLVNAMHHAMKKHPDLVLLIAGRSEGATGRRIIERFRSFKWCRYLGFVAEEELPLLYNAADVFVMPSLYEGLPLTVLEAMASGLPVICSEIDSLSFVKEHGVGISVPFSNPLSAAEEIARFLSSDYAALGASARRVACKIYDWEVVAKAYVGVFRRAVGADA